MASIRERESSDGTTSYAVLFKRGSKQTSETFHDRKSAVKFQRLIEAVGAEDAIKIAKAEQAKGVTLDQLADLWFEARAADVLSGELTPRVLAGYRRDYDLWLRKRLGWRPATSIGEGDVQDWIDSMKGRLSAKTIADRHALLHGMFKWASAAKRNASTGITHNPCKETDLPERRKKMPKGLRLPELQALSATARASSPHAADLIDFLAGTGWRLGEAIALTAGQVEDDGVRVFVTMSRVWRRDVGYVEDDGKSSAAMRRLQVLGSGVAAVRRNVVGKGPGDLVFTPPNAPQWSDTNFRHNYFRPIADAAGLGARKPTPHWLRHTHVLVCHAAGMSLPEIQRRIGHENIQMTIDTYGKLIDDMSADVAARLDALLGGSAAVAPPVGVLLSGESQHLGE